MSFWVYILRCADNSYYTGHTDNLEERIAKHQSGEIEGYTPTRLPVRLVFSEQFPTREEALTCERQIKGWGRKKKEALMQGDWAEVSRLAHRNYSKLLRSPSTLRGASGGPSTAFSPEPVEGHGERSRIELKQGNKK
jgi:predicted GIY-YIG superfamily endonuclease